ncbi:hypothetical protein N9O79_02510 [Luminiphilus sp.]|nr:hypothetical protein [Luminiphilus sp.]
MTKPLLAILLSWSLTTTSGSFADSAGRKIADSYFEYHDNKQTLKYLQGRPAASKQKDVLRIKEALKLIKELGKDDPSVRVEQARNRMLGWKADIQYLSAGADCEPRTKAMFDQLLSDMEPLLSKATADWKAGSPKRWGHDDKEWREYYSYQNIRGINNKFIKQFKKRERNASFQKCSAEKGFEYDQLKMNHIDRQIKRAKKQINKRAKRGDIGPLTHQLALLEISRLSDARNFTKREENRGLWTNFDPHTEPFYRSLAQILLLGEGKSSGSFFLQELSVSRHQIKKTGEQQKNGS